MTARLRELIRGVRACKTAAEEREVIAKESAALREAFRDQDANAYRHRNVAKLMYIHMLGYPTHFGQMETLKLIAAAGFAEKRIGYLGLMILLDERQEVLMLVTNSIKMDMSHKNPYIAGLALAALGNICSTEMARDLAPDLEGILEAGSPYLKKKAALCAIRVLKKVPDLVEQFADRAVSLLKSNDGAVQLAGVALMLQVIDLEPAQIESYRPHVPNLCQLLRRLMQPGGGAAEYDISGISNPFLQVKVLKLLRYLGRGNAQASDQMSDILAQVASNVDSSRNAGNAVLYECVQTIMGVESMGGLRLLAINVLAKFLANKDNNMRYVALNTLAKVVAVDSQAVQRHRSTIVECVKDADVSIRRRALELVYGLVNESNIKNLTRELLDYLAVCDAEFKPDLTAKICTLIQRFAPDKRWHIDSLMQVMTQAGAFVKPEVCRAFVVLITNAPELHAYSVRSLYRNLHAYQDVAAESLLTTALWCIGEFGEMLVPGGPGGPLLDGEPPINCTDKDVVDLLAVMVLKKQSDPVVREFGLTAAMKLTARLPGQAQRLQVLLGKTAKSPELEVQARSAEYGRMFNLDTAVRSQLLERMPALDEAEYAQHTGAALPPTSGFSSSGGAATSAGGAASSAAAAGGVPAMPAAAKAVVPAAARTVDDLLGDLDVPMPAAPATTARPAGLDALQDLLASPAAAAAPAATPAAGLDLLDLLGGGTAPAAAAPAPAPAQPAAAAAPAGTTVQVYSNPAGLAITFTCTKPEGKEVTHVVATCTNTGSSPLTSFIMQAAVPKYITLKLEPASGSTLPAGGTTSIVQKIVLTNSMQGTKPLAVRLRITYTDAAGAQQVEQTTVDNLPADL